MTLTRLAPAAAPVATEPELREWYRLRADATAGADTGGRVVLRQTRFQLTLERLGLSRHALVLQLAERWVAEDEVNALVRSIEGEQRILAAQVLLRRLVAHSWLARRLQFGDRPLLELLPRALGAGSVPTPLPHQPTTRYCLSRFATLRAESGRLTAHTALAPWAVGLADPGLCGLLVRAAGAGCDLAGLAEAADLPPGVAGRVLDELLTAGVFVPAVAREAEDGAPPRAFWSPEELALHDRSRPGHHALAVGGTYRFRGVVAPEPVRRTFPGTPVVPLPVPDLDAVIGRESALTEVIRSRRSLREHDQARPIGVAQLAEFLYRVQHAGEVRELDGQQVASRPYPSGGQLYELELYACVSRCDGLDPGLYHYDSLDHRLEHLSPPGPALDRMLGYARAAANMSHRPQVLLVTSARIGRLLWKYEGMGYAMVLKHTGVLTELMYLVATAMRLAPCALGAGDSAAFAAAAGIDPLVEPSVADFVLGSRMPVPGSGLEE